MSTLLSSPLCITVGGSGYGHLWSLRVLNPLLVLLLLGLPGYDPLSVTITLGDHIMVLLVHELVTSHHFLEKVSEGLNGTSGQTGKLTVMNLFRWSSSRRNCSYRLLRLTKSPPSSAGEGGLIGGGDWPRPTRKDAGAIPAGGRNGGLS